MRSDKLKNFEKLQRISMGIYLPTGEYCFFGNRENRSLLPQLTKSILEWAKI
jgi:hypothetical protein